MSGWVASYIIIVLTANSESGVDSAVLIANLHNELISLDYLDAQPATSTSTASSVH